MRNFIFIITLLTAYISISAATIPFTVQPPKWTKLAVCDTEGGVNIRKSPSTNAPKLVFMPNDDETCEMPESYWSSSKTNNKEMASTFCGQAPIISQTDDWLELEGIGPSGSNGWVSAKYCDIVEPRPMVTGQYNTPDFRWLTNPNDVKSGNYAIYCSFMEMDGFCLFYVGREIDGVLVCPYIVACQSECDYDKECNLILSNYGFEGSDHYRFIYGEKESLDYAGFDLNKIPAKAMESIISAAEKLETPVVVYRLNGRYCSTGEVY